MNDPDQCAAVTRICEGLTGLRLRFTLEMCAEADLGDFSGFTLRGALAAHLRRMVCVTNLPRCDRCWLRNECAYYRLFEASAPAESVRAGGFKDPPRPIVMHYPDAVQTRFRPGDRLRFELLVLGDTAAYASSLVYAIRRMETAGLGYGHKEGKGRFFLRETDVIGRGGEVLPLNDVASTSPGCVPVPDLTSVRADAPENITITLVTPLRLKKAGRWLNAGNLQFDHLVESLLRRQMVLNACYGEAHEIDKVTLLKAASRVRVTRRDLRWRFQERYSYRQRRSMPMDGLLGAMEVEGDLTPFWPLLRAGTLLHAGKGATMGMGQFDVE